MFNAILDEVQQVTLQDSAVVTARHVMSTPYILLQRQWSREKRTDGGWSLNKVCWSLAELKDLLQPRFCRLSVWFFKSRPVSLMQYTVKLNQSPQMSQGSLTFSEGCASTHMVFVSLLDNPVWAGHSVLDKIQGRVLAGL